MGILPVISHMVKNRGKGPLFAALFPLSDASAMKMAFVYSLIPIKYLFITLKPYKFPLDFAVITIFPFSVNYRTPVRHIFSCIKQYFFQEITTECLSGHSACIVHTPNRNSAFPDCLPKKPCHAP
ncbi:hypothetical protein HL650_25655 [Blautia pseudococcoides]|nr:hypothetical protein HL650_25655 [Blautia pseudococcoides]